MSNKDQILANAKTTLELESKAIFDLISTLDDQFVSTVEHLSNFEGRVIITGIGKSAVIAMKIVATLNSTGTAAVFMHAADAIHGDLGIIQDKDAVICISKSGNSPEIQALIPFIKKRGNLVIAFTANPDSFLAKTADKVISTYVEKEACPNNLAPTTSTTVQLAVGDALAVCLLKLKNFNENDFAQHHPGGALGKKLYLTAGELAKKHERPSVETNSPVKIVISEITKKRLGATVVKRNNKIVGIITDGDIRRMLENHDNIGNLTAQDIMSANPITIDPEKLAFDVMTILKSKDIGQLIVEDSTGYYLGMVHILDLIKEGIE
ncbi:MAG: KpsF/GutQ family sugar-phosphate isomerase [Flavobacteriaceae bacterium]|nr:KpsF/GutQ family sugar-phosphate isomerase [Flavobacteriaceae bacterium]